MSAGIVAGSGRGPPVQFAFVVALAGDGFSRQVLDLVFVRDALSRAFRFSLFVVTRVVLVVEQTHTVLEV